jgi:hypothetical protein
MMTDRLKPTPKPENLINWRKKRCATIAKGSASSSRETRFGSQPEIFRRVSTSAPGIRGRRGKAIDYSLPSRQASNSRRSNGSSTATSFARLASRATGAFLACR